jgi:hypothetical protein
MLQFCLILGISPNKAIFCSVSEGFQQDRLQYEQYLGLSCLEIVAESE